LIQNKFLPAMLYNPNCFDGYSIAELVTEINNGILKTKELIANPDKEIWDYKTPDEPAVTWWLVK
jgi:hypothetical protein